MARESTYQAKLIKTLKEVFPGCTVLKNDSGYLPGVPDLTVLFRDKWAMLEVKPSERYSTRPNQSYWIEQMNEASFAAFIFPENESEVLDELQHAFGLGR